MSKYDYLNDSSFLKEIDLMRIKEQYIKITVLDFQERPLENIQGKIISGNININGSSSIRRTCNLTMVADAISNNLSSINDAVLSINKKISLEVGFLNTTSRYKREKIIWFPLGVYVIITSSLSRSSSGVTISLQLKDKMCLLNGECGGLLPASVTFHEYETINEKGEYITLKPTIYQIIQELVNHFGGEQLGKIIISDIDTRAKQVMKWSGSSPVYIAEKQNGEQSYVYITVDANDPNLGDSYTYYNYGRDIGYIYTDFTYPGELIGNAGDSVCAILDNIKNLLGNYEYFYDLDGNFVFQEVKNYLNTTQAKVDLEKINNNDYIVDYSKGKSVYSFDNNILITSYSNSPQYQNIKNDFIVWGLKENANGNKMPIRYHLAIDKKPAVGNTYQCFKYLDPYDNITKMKRPLGFEKYSDFPKVGMVGTFYMDKENNKVYSWTGNDYKEVSGLQEVVTSDWRTELYLSGVTSEPYATDSNYYYSELLNEWPKIYDVENGYFIDKFVENPSDIDYFLDFIDSNGAIAELSVSNIGRRQKVIVDDNVNCIFEPEIPNYVLIEAGKDNTEKLKKECEQRGDKYILVSSTIFEYISGGGRFNSAYNLIRQLLHESTSYNESISISALPIYYLEPNTRITVKDTRSGIFGDYMINTISLPLGINGGMTLTCSRALEKF